MSFGWMVVLAITLGVGCRPEPVAETNAATHAEVVAKDTPKPVVEEEVEDVTVAEVRALVDQWREAQNRGDFERYQAFYGESFRGVKRVGERTEEFDRPGWIADRQRMFEKPMSVSTENISIRTAERRATVRFVQTWSSGSYRDTGPKELTLQMSADGLRITGEVMLRSTVGASGNSVARPEDTTVEALLASAKMVAFSSDDVMFDPRRDGACGGSDECSDEWLDLGGDANGFSRETITREQAAEYLGFLSSPKSYGAPPAACYVPRLVVAFYHPDEPIPWATVGVCIECATLGTWPRVEEIEAAIPEEGSGLGELDELTAWCKSVGLPECTDDVPYYKAQ